MRTSLCLLALILGTAQARADLLYAARSDGAVIALDTNQAHPLILTAATGLGYLQGLAVNRFGDIVTDDFTKGILYEVTQNGSHMIAQGLDGPAGLAINQSTNELFIASYGSGTISRLAPGGAITPFVTGLDRVFGLAFDGSGNLYASELNGTIVRINASGVVTTFVTGLKSPEGMAFDAAGNLYVSEYSGGDVLRFGSPLLGVNRSVFSTGYLGPEGLAFDSGGNLFVGDFLAAELYKVAPDGTKSFVALTGNSVAMLAFAPFDGGAAVPEPASWALLSLALAIPLGVARARRAGA